jgi:hypothetical protein
MYKVRCSCTCVAYIKQADINSQVIGKKTAIQITLTNPLQYDSLIYGWNLYKNTRIFAANDALTHQYSHKYITDRKRAQLFRENQPVAAAA